MRPFLLTVALVLGGCADRESLSTALVQRPDAPDAPIAPTVTHVVK